MLPTPKLIEIWRQVSNKHNCKANVPVSEYSRFLALAYYRPLQPPISLEKHNIVLVYNLGQKYQLGHRFICPTYRTKSKNFLNLQSMMKHDFCLKHVLRHFKDKNTS